MIDLSFIMKMIILCSSDIDYPIIVQRGHHWFPHLCSFASGDISWYLLISPKLSPKLWLWTMETRILEPRQRPAGARGWFCSCLVWTMFGVARHLVLSSQQASPWMKVDDTSTVNRLLSIWYSPRDLVAVLDLLIVGSISKFCISNSSNYNLV